MRFINVRFVDTNILLYSISTAPEEQEKAQIAREIMQSRDLALSVQVVQEFYVQATRPSRPDRISDEHARLLIQSFMRFPIQDVSMVVALLAMGSHREFDLSYWDAAIIAAAASMKCDVVLSEDMDPSRDYHGTRVVNPFI